MPEAVVARLDGVLAGLSADRAAPSAPTRTDRAPGRRPRRPPAPRTAANLLVAAAAVLVVGFGITQVLPDGMGGSDGDAQAATRRGRRGRRQSPTPATAAAATSSPRPRRRPPPTYDERRPARALPDPLRAVRPRRAPGARSSCCSTASAALVEYPAPELPDRRRRPPARWSRRPTTAPPPRSSCAPPRATSRSSTSTCAATPRRDVRSRSPHPDRPRLVTSDTAGARVTGVGNRSATGRRATPGHRPAGNSARLRSVPPACPDGVPGGP